MSWLYETVSVATIARLQIMQSMAPASRGIGFTCVPTRSYTDSALIEVLEIPTYLNTVELLLFVGFDYNKAYAIFNKWEETRGQDKLKGAAVDALVRYAISWIEEKAKIFNVTEVEDDWDDALRNMGLSLDFRDRILDPSFDWLRLSKSASHWAIDSIESDYHFLVHLERSILKRMESQSVGSAVPSGISSDHAPRETHQEAEAEGLWRFKLFKGGREGQLRRCLEDNGDIDLGWLTATPPSDFHPTSVNHIYLTSHSHAAEQYAAYAERRSHCGDRGAVLSIAIPGEYTIDAQSVFRDWHDLVWYSLHPSPSDEDEPRVLPKHLELYEKEGLLVGAVPDASPHRMPKLSNKNEIKLLKLPNRERMSHWVINGEVFRRELEERCRGFVRVQPRDNAMDTS